MKMDPQLKDIFAKYGGNAETDLWDCHGNWIAYHKALERIATKANITFDSPHIIEANGAEKVAAICVTGNMGERTEWSVGEASPLNYKTSAKQAAYPWAMAEKRGKDRVILKLLGLHGMVYSEEEADDFKQQNVKSAHAARKDGDWEALTASMRKQNNTAKLEEWAQNNKAGIDRLPGNWRNILREEYATYKTFLADSETT